MIATDMFRSDKVMLNGGRTTLVLDKVPNKPGHVGVPPELSQNPA